MISSYLPAVFMLILAVLFPAGLLWATSVLGPRVRVQTKDEAYECGVPSPGNPRERFPVKFYRLAILFLLFDVEAAFLFPWVVLFRGKLEGWGAAFLLGELALFLLVLLAGYVYAWKSGALEWD